MILPLSVLAIILFVEGTIRLLRSNGDSERVLRLGRGRAIHQEEARRWRTAAREHLRSLVLDPGLADDVSDVVELGSHVPNIASIHSPDAQSLWVGHFPRRSEISSHAVASTAALATQRRYRVYSGLDRRSRHVIFDRPVRVRALTEGRVWTEVRDSDGSSRVRAFEWYSR